MLNWYRAGLKDLLNRLKPATVVAATGDTTLGNPVFTDDVNPSLLEPGMTISSPQFPAGTKVVSVVADAVTMDANATATAASPTATVTGVLPSGIISPVTVRPVIDAIPLDPDTPFSGFTEPVLAGVAPVELTLSKTGPSGNEGELITAQCVEWQPSDSVGSADITGVLYTLAGQPDPIPIVADVFSGPFNLSTPDDLLKFVPSLSLPFAPGTQAGLIL